MFYELTNKEALISPLSQLSISQNPKHLGHSVSHVITARINIYSLVTSLGMPEPLLIHAFVQSANRCEAVQCIQ